MKKKVVLSFVFANLLFSQEINSFDDLRNFIKDGWENGYFPKSIISHHGNTRLKDINLEFRDIIGWTIQARCDPHENEVIIANKEQDDSIMCSGNDNIYILKGGNNELEDHFGNEIIVLGSGDDKIKVSDSAVFIAQKGWGHDEIELTEPFSMEYYGMHSGYLANKFLSQMKGYDGSYPYSFFHFIVFGEGIQRDDLAWKDTTLINTKTGDSIKLNTKNVNLLFKDDENPKVDINFIKSKFEPYDVDLQSENINQIYNYKDFIYLTSEFGSVKQAKLVDYKTAKIQKEIWTKEYIRKLAFSDNFVFISEWGNDNLAFLSVFDKELNLLERLTFKGSIFDIKVHKDVLYVLQNYRHGEDNLLIYDISNPDRITLLDELKTPHLLALEIIDDYMFAKKWSIGIAVYDISNHKKPNLVMNEKDFRAMSFKKYGDFTLINQEKSLFGIYKFNANSLDKKCEINLPKDENQKDLWGLSSNSIFVLDNMAFVANGEAGIFVINLKNCEIKERLQNSHYSSSLYQINDNLVVPQKDKLYFINLRNYFPNKKFIEFEKKTEKNVNLQIPQDEKLSKDKIQTLLFKSAYNNDYDEAMKYCKMGGDPNSKAHERTTPLEMAVRLKNINSAKAMLDCSKKAGDYAVMLSVFSTTKTNDEELAFLRLFEEYGGNFKAKDSSGCSMLNYAASHSSLEVIKFLIEKGADINARCRGNASVTPLDWAKSNEKHPEVLEYLQNLVK